MTEIKDSLFARFNSYVCFSVRVDRFFNIANIYASHHEGFEKAYELLPPREILKEAIETSESEGIKQFIWASTNVMNKISVTNIYDNQNDQSGGHIPTDMSNFAFYTCYCFQWSLFEDYVKSMIRELIDNHKLPEKIEQKLEKKWRNTKDFFDIINKGVVFGASPFNSILPALDQNGEFEKINYKLLNEIREQRNRFIHGVENTEITPESILNKQKDYEKSMWILRKCSENILHDSQRISV